VLYLANGNLRNFDQSRDIKISLRESSLTNLARFSRENRIGAMPYHHVHVSLCPDTALPGGVLHTESI